MLILIASAGAALAADDSALRREYLEVDGSATQAFAIARQQTGVRTVMVVQEGRWFKKRTIALVEGAASNVAALHTMMGDKIFRSEALQQPLEMIVRTWVNASWAVVTDAAEYDFGQHGKNKLDLKAQFDLIEQLSKDVPGALNSNYRPRVPVQGYLWLMHLPGEATAFHKSSNRSMGDRPAN